jgi:hypothetical protein
MDRRTVVKDVGLVVLGGFLGVAGQVAVSNHFAENRDLRIRVDVIHAEPSVPAVSTITISNDGNVSERAIRGTVTFASMQIEKIDTSNYSLAGFPSTAASGFAMSESASAIQDEVLRPRRTYAYQLDRLSPGDSIVLTYLMPGVVPDWIEADIQSEGDSSYDRWTPDEYSYWTPTQ